MGRMDLEIIANFSKHSDPAQQKIVLEYFESFKNNPNGWRQCSETLSVLGDKDESATFFCLQVIDHYVRSNYENDTIDNNLELKRFIVQWFEGGLFRTNYLQNKYAYIVNSMFLIDFPRNRWDDFFKDFLIRCTEEVKYCLFLRILIQINLDLTDRDFPRTDKEIKRNTYIKDLMRKNCLLDLAQFWFGILSLYKSLSLQTVLLCLETISVYVSWIDINLITNASTMSSLFVLFSEEQYRCGVMDCFNEILRKGMDSRAKTQIIEDFMNIECIKSTIEAILERKHVTDQMFVEKFAKLINTIGIELIEAYKKEALPAKNKSNAMVNGGQNGQDLHAIQVISASIESKYNLMCRFMEFKTIAISYKVHPFAKEYLAWIRMVHKDRNNEMANTIEEKIIFLLSIIMERSKYPDDESVEDETFEDYRKSNKILFDNLMLMSGKSVFAFVCNNLIRPTLASCQSSTPAKTIAFAELELALYYFLLVGESTQIVTENGKIFEDLLHLLITSYISNQANSVIQGLYFDLLVRYGKFLNTSLSFLFPQVLRAFLDQRGLCNQDYKLRSKVCKTFKKFLIRTKYNYLETYVDDILKRLQELIEPGIVFDDLDALNELGVEDLANSEWLVHRENLDAARCISTTDQLQIYEIIAFLIVSNPSFDGKQKNEFMEALLKTIWSKFDQLWEQIGQLAMQNGVARDESLEKKWAKVLHLAHCINAFSCSTKSYSTLCTMKSINVHQDYLGSFELFLKTYALCEDDRSRMILQSSIRQYLHRLILCLNEEDIIPVLPDSIRTLFLSPSSPSASSAEISSRSMQEFIPLLQQIVIKFKGSWLYQRDLSPFVCQIFAPMVVAFFKLIVEANSEGDKLQLQKTYYTFLHTMLFNRLLPTFFELDAQLVEQILGSLTEGLVNLADVTQITIAIIPCLMDLYANDIVQPEKQNRPINSCFVAFVYKSLVPALFLVASRNARSVSLLTDVINCLRRLHQLLGEDFCVYLRIQILAQHFKSIDNKDELITLLLGTDLKTSMPTFKQIFSQFS